MTVSSWTPDHVAGIARQPVSCAPLIARAEASALLPGVDLWDYWPVQEEDGRVAGIAGGTLHMLLSAPAMGDPDMRHAVARIRLMLERADGWIDLGPALPYGHAPGSREWSGSAVVDRAHRRLTLYFTAAGVRGEAGISYRQRLFETHADLVDEGGTVMLAHWSPPMECFAPDGDLYTGEMEGGGAIGTIKAFRDPAFFRDPADGRDYLLFTGSLARSASPWNGTIGVARRDGSGWALLPPLISADGVNNELERPHVIVRDGHYYLFWCTQRKVFADGGPSGPNGLYGMVADRLAGPWRALNGTGLVVANPSVAPFQAYSWLVLNDLTVLSFADMVGISSPPADPVVARAHFGGTPAPLLRLSIDGDKAGLA